MRMTRITGLGAALLMVACAFLAGCGDDSVSSTNPAEENQTGYGTYDDFFDDNSSDPYEPRDYSWDDPNSENDQLNDDEDPYAQEGDDVLDKDDNPIDPGDNKDGGLGK